jgi:hypothetical protein
VRKALRKKKYVKGDVSIRDSLKKKVNQRGLGSHRPLGTTAGLNVGSKTRYISTRRGQIVSFHSVLRNNSDLTNPTHDKVKLKFTLEQTKKAQRYRYSTTLFLTSALDGVGGQRHAPAALPARKTRYPLYMTLGGPQSQSGQEWKISHPPGFDLPTVQPVASRYTD